MTLTHDELVEKLPNWPVGMLESFNTLVEELTAHLAGYGRVWTDGDGKLRIATGGWSENEEIVNALMQNRLFVALCWESSHRGGLHVFRIPLTKS